jgi:hypothetical protein
LIGVGLHVQLQLRRLFGLSEYRLHYVGTTFTMKMNSNNKILCCDMVNNWNISVLKGS